jgi:hypothetical protein
MAFTRQFWIVCLKSRYLTFLLHFYGNIPVLVCLILLKAVGVLELESIGLKRFRKPLMLARNCSEKSLVPMLTGFWNPLGLTDFAFLISFQRPSETHQAAFRNRLLTTLVTFDKNSSISKIIHRSTFRTKIFFYLGDYEAKTNLKTNLKTVPVSVRHKVLMF